MVIIYVVLIFILLYGATMMTYMRKGPEALAQVPIGDFTPRLVSLYRIPYIIEKPVGGGINELVGGGINELVGGGINELVGGGINELVAVIFKYAFIRRTSTEFRVKKTRAMFTIVHSEDDVNVTIGSLEMKLPSTRVIIVPPHVTISSKTNIKCEELYDWSSLLAAPLISIFPHNAIIARSL
jgi:hypothetical protein